MVSKYLSDKKELPAIVIPLSVAGQVKKQTLEDYTQKANLVTKELSALLKKIDKEIVGASYVVTDCRTEFVRVHYKGGSYYDKNVTGCSLGVIAIDVIERII